MQCGNNLKQIGLALHGYHAAYICFPPAGIGYGWCSYPTEKYILNASGLMMLLPYLEQTGMYNAYDQNHCACDLTVGFPPSSANTATGQLMGDPVTDGNAKVVSMPLAVYTCPSDAGDPLEPISPYYGIKNGNSTYRSAKTNYDFSVSTYKQICDWWLSPKRDPGVEADVRPEQQLSHSRHKGRHVEYDCLGRNGS